MSWIKTHKNFVAVLAISIFTFLLYANSLANGFISDDIASIVQNPNLSNTLSFLNPLDPHPTQILHSLIFQLVGLNPWLYHLNNIVWHILTAALVFYVVKLLSNNFKLAVLTSLLFGIHPMHTEPVNWLSGLPYLLYSFFSLATLFVIIAIDKERIRRRWWITLPFLGYLAFFSSEKSLILPIIVLVYFVVLSKLRRGIIPLTILGSMWFFPIVKLLGRFGDRIEAVNPAIGATPTVFNPLLQIPVAIGTYLKLWIFPTELTLYHEFILTSLEVVIFYVLLFLFLGLIVFLFLKKQKLLFWGLLFFFIGLVPTLLPIKIAWIAAERYVYFPSFGLLLLEAWVLERLRKFNRWVFLGVVILLIVMYSVIVFNRNRQWHDPDTFWQATVLVSPKSAMAHNNMGELYYRHGDIDRAIQEFSTSLVLNPESAEPAFNLGNIYFERRDASRSAYYFDHALKNNPNILGAALGLVIVNLWQQREVEAKYYMQQAEKIPLTSPNDYNDWGVLYLNLGNKEKAREMFEKALSIDPTYKLAQQNLQLIK